MKDKGAIDRSTAAVTCPWLGTGPQHCLRRGVSGKGPLEVGYRPEREGLRQKQSEWLRDNSTEKIETLKREKRAQPSVGDTETSCRRGKGQSCQDHKDPTKV